MDAIALGLYELPGRLLVSADVEGSVFDATIGEIRAQVHFPVLGRTSWDRVVVLPPAVVTRIPSSALLVQPESPHEWGRAWNLVRDRSRATSFTTHMLAVSVPFAGDAEMRGPEGAGNLHRSIDAWARLFIEWIEVVTGQPHSTALSEARSSVVGRGLRMWAASGESWNPLSPRESITQTAAPQLTPASLPQVRYGVSKASDGQRPELGHQLLREARIAHQTGQFRRAAIDAGAAAEIALKSALAIRLGALRVHDAELVDLLDSSARTLGALRRFTCLLPSAGVDAQDVANMSRVRNAAAHNGTDPLEKDVRECVDLAGRLVRSAWPHPVQVATVSQPLRLIQIVSIDPSELNPE